MARKKNIAPVVKSVVQDAETVLERAIVRFSHIVLQFTVENGTQISWEVLETLENAEVADAVEYATVRFSQVVCQFVVTDGTTVHAYELEPEYQEIGGGPTPPTPGPTPVYSLASPTTFDGTNVIDTGINLAKDGLGDSDWTITGTYIDNWSNYNKKMLGFMNDNNLAVGNTAGISLKFFAGLGITLCPNAALNQGDGILRKIVIRRRQGELSLLCDARIKDTYDQQTVLPASSKTLENYLATTFRIFIGGLSASSPTYIGQCTEFSIYDQYLDDNTVQQYLES